MTRKPTDIKPTVRTVETESPHFAQEQQAEWLALIAQQVRRHTSGDSSSVRIEVAKELAASLAYTVKCAEEARPRSDEKQRLTLPELYDLGRQEIAHRISVGRNLYLRTLQTRLSMPNVCYHESLQELGNFFDRYDAEFFAHEIPCMIDYPLAHPTKEESGINYICDYLRRIAAENEVCLHFDSETMHQLNGLLCPGYEEMPVNLYEPVAFYALGLCMCGKEPYDLSMNEKERNRLLQSYQALTVPQRSELTMKASAELCERLNITHKNTVIYLTHTAKTLAVRMSAAEKGGSFEPLFPDLH